MSRRDLPDSGTTKRLSRTNNPETIDSGEYQVTELRTLLFPSVVGTAAIDPAGLAVSTGSSGAQSLLESLPVAVKVRPLPAGSPAEFTGAVGRFDISSKEDAAAGQVNEPVQITVTVSGEGNIEALPDPSWPEFAGWRVIESPADASTQIVAGQVTGSRTFRIILVPERAGELIIPEIGYTHFDPDSGRFVQAATAPIVISVAGSDGQAAAPARPATSGGEESGRDGDEAHQGCAAVAAPVGKGTDRKRSVLGRVGSADACRCGRVGLAPQAIGPGIRPGRFAAAECPAGRQVVPGRAPWLPAVTRESLPPTQLCHTSRHDWKSRWPD